MSSLRIMYDLELQRIRGNVLMAAFATLTSLLTVFTFDRDVPVSSSSLASDLEFMFFVFLIVYGGSFSVLYAQSLNDDSVAGLLATYLTYPVKASDIVLSKALAFLSYCLPSVLIPMVILLATTPFSATLGIGGVFLVGATLAAIIFLCLAVAMIGTILIRLRPLSEIFYTAYFLFVAFYAPSLQAPLAYIPAPFLIIVNAFNGISPGLKDLAYASLSVPLYAGAVVAAVLYHNWRRFWVGRP